MAYTNITQNKVSELNSTSITLNSLATFIGVAEDVSKYNSVVFAIKTDTDCTLYLDFSPDGTNWDSTLTFNINANINDVHRITVTRKFCRIRVYNGSLSNQTFLRLQTTFGNQEILTSSLNSTVQEDADTVVVRPLDFNLMVAEGKYQNRTINLKDGINFDIDTTGLPEDLWETGGAYTGFPLGTPEEGQIVVAGADTGTVFYFYLSSENDTDYLFGSLAINGAGTYNLGHNIWRCNYAYFKSVNQTAFNVGNITIRNAVTTTNVFCTLLAGYSQTFCAAYTVPAGSKIFIDRLYGNLRGATTGSCDGIFYYRKLGDSPLLRFPFELTFGTLYFDDIDYTITIPEKVDIIPRIMSASANNLTVKVSYRLLKVKG